MPESIHHRRETCRVCGSRSITPFLDLGLQPLANALPASPEDFEGEPRFPLVVHFCPDCTLVQLVDVVSPVLLFRDYIYVTGMSTSMADHNRAYADAVAESTGLDRTGLVVDIASNDGSLLKAFRQHTPRVLGVEPAENIAEMARESGIDTISEFFGEETVARIRSEHGPATAVLANNVLAHVDDPVSFVRNMAALLSAEGALLIEAPYLGDLVRRMEYDTVYHEHLSYFSVNSLIRLFTLAGVRIDRIDHVRVHGGSLRIRGRRADGVPRHDGAVLRLAEEEVREGLGSAETFVEFAESVRNHRLALRGFLQDLRGKGWSLGAYGAPAKGNTLLNYCGIGPDTLEFTVDRNPLKQGRYLPGTHIPVEPTSAVLGRQPDGLLILPWNIAAEIVDQEREYSRRGGRFLLPVPEPELI